MASLFVPNQNIDGAIAVEAPGHVFDAGKEPWFGRAVNCLRLCSLSPGQAK